MIKFFINTFYEFWNNLLIFNSFCISFTDSCLCISRDWSSKKTTRLTIILQSIILIKSWTDINNIITCFTTSYILSWQMHVINMTNYWKLFPVLFNNCELQPAVIHQTINDQYNALSVRTINNFINLNHSRINNKEIME